jgi:CDP-diglyceride synthetase
MISFKVRWLDLFLGILSVALLVVIFALSASFPKPHEGQLGAAIFPRIIALLLAIVGIYISYQAIRRKSSAKVDINSTEKVFLSFLILLLYGLFLKKVGFVILTPVFIAVLLVLMKFSNIMINILTSILTTAGIYIIFKILLSVPLPEGILGF